MPRHLEIYAYVYPQVFTIGAFIGCCTTYGMPLISNGYCDKHTLHITHTFMQILRS